MLNAPLDRVTNHRLQPQFWVKVGPGSFGLPIPGTQGIIATEANGDTGGVLRGQTSWLEGPDKSLR